VSTAHGERSAPNTAATSTNAQVLTSTRNPTKARCPPTTSAMRSGLATWAWYVRIHLKCPSTGQVQSPTATWKAVDAISPGIR
jgi:hypothetical protein